MAISEIIKERAKRPAPKWFRILNKVWGQVENFIIALLLLFGYGNESFTMLIVKLTSSFLREFLNTILVEIENDDNE